MITIVGVGHVFAISDKIIKVIEKIKPDLIAIELDPARFQALLAPHKPAFHGSLLFYLMSIVQLHIARLTNSELGDEMITAGKMAQQLNVPLAFLDMDLRTISEKVLHNVPKIEKLKLLISMFFVFLPSRKSKRIQIDSIFEQENEFIEILRKKFPTFSRILIDDRNQFMANRLRSLALRYNNIIAFVGDAHVPGIQQLLKSCNIIRLSELIHYSASATNTL